MNKPKIVLNQDTWITLYCEIAFEVVEFYSQDEEIWVSQDNGESHQLTENKQDEFNRIVELVEQIMSDTGLIKGDK